ncbi:MAG TPA: carboxypeptidase regulatory-like domain-containing protein [Longimicrobiales bacterium]|nr:carboxypeptidase regulatory-like domain-containing protein [Longimicrobiales bacterium]
MPRLIVSAPFAMLLALTQPLAGQAIRGVLLEESSGRPIVAANISLLLRNGKADFHVSTDTAGAFLIETDAPGIYRLKADRLGYSAATTDTFHLHSGELVQVTLRLAPDAIALTPLTVTARSYPPSAYLTNAGFYDRKRLGIGTFMTRTEIARRNTHRFSDVLRSVAGMRIDPADAGGRSRSRVARSIGRCQPLLVLDGVVTTIGGGRSMFRSADIPLDDVLDATDIEGLEIYRGSSELPMQYNVGTADCGAILVWTRRK